MTHFEQHLISVGFERFEYDKKTKQLIPAIGYNLSSIGNLDYRFIKGDLQIVFGLHEKGKPPTLIYPRPEGINSDDQMNRMLMEKQPNYILQMLE